MKKRKTLADLTYEELLNSLKFSARQLGGSGFKTAMIMQELLRRNLDKKEKDDKR